MEYINLIATGLIYPVIYFISKHFASSYFNEKGKNLATKEDIGKITEEVKKVESMFSISTNSENDYNTLKRKAILDYFNALNTWSSFIISDSYQYEKSKLNENNLLLEKIRSSYIDALIRYESLFLFVPRTPFEQLSIKAFQKVMHINECLENLCTIMTKLYFDVYPNNELKAKDEIKTLLSEYSIELLDNMVEYRESNTYLISFLNEQIIETFKKQGA
ncbi:hypothetical protein CMT92_07355 [Elizabethkingia anophelis]|uniref:hypothetical protein n=1 Tax=Elizabethkingia anophelis TaxID=1117645 RepID=UPI0021A28BFF|nr:hypothetical protein [Elizabethkingia anophelis]MCT3871772.1 hypothetical protein [Elizabethkingia anophelis]MDV3847468.1 hypothetical protein [Elizabethkingia anophelis]